MNIERGVNKSEEKRQHMNGAHPISRVQTHPNIKGSSSQCNCKDTMLAGKEIDSNESKV